MGEFAEIKKELSLFKAVVSTQPRAGHKYVRREGGPGNYIYWYAEDLERKEGERQPAEEEVTLREEKKEVSPQIPKEEKGDVEYRERYNKVWAKLGKMEAAYKQVQSDKSASPEKVEQMKNVFANLQTKARALPKPKEDIKVKPPGGLSEEDKAAISRGELTAAQKESKAKYESWRKKKYEEKGWTGKKKASEAIPEVKKERRESQEPPVGKEKYSLGNSVTVGGKEMTITAVGDDGFTAEDNKGSKHQVDWKRAKDYGEPTKGGAPLADDDKEYLRAQGFTEEQMKHLVKVNPKVADRAKKEFFAQRPRGKGEKMGKALIEKAGEETQTVTAPAGGERSHVAYTKRSPTGKTVQVKQKGAPKKEEEGKKKEAPPGFEYKKLEEVEKLADTGFGKEGEKTQAGEKKEEVKPAEKKEGEKAEKVLPKKGEKIKKPAETAGKQKVEEVITSPEDVKKFQGILDGLFGVQDQLKTVKDQLEALTAKKEEFAALARPYIVKFNNLEKEESKFRAEFQDRDFLTKMFNSPRITVAWKGLAEKAIPLLNEELQKQMNDLKRQLTSITAQEKWERKPVEKALELLLDTFEKAGVVAKKKPAAKPAEKSKSVAKPQAKPMAKPGEEPIKPWLSRRKTVHEYFDNNDEPMERKDVNEEKNDNEQKEDSKSNILYQKDGQSSAGVLPGNGQQMNEGNGQQMNEGGGGEGGDAYQGIIEGFKKILALKERGVALFQELSRVASGEEAAPEENEVAQKAFKSAVLDIIKSRFVTLMKGPHKYIKREGGKGQYKYFYQMPFEEMKRPHWFKDPTAEEDEGIAERRAYEKFTPAEADLLYEERKEKRERSPQIPAAYTRVYREKGSNTPGPNKPMAGDVVELPNGARARITQITESGDIEVMQGMGRLSVVPFDNLDGEWEQRKQGEGWIWFANEGGKAELPTVKERSPQIPAKIRKYTETVLVDLLEPTHPVDLNLPPSQSKGPIQVWKDVETNKMYIEDGHRRVRDAIRAGIKEIKATITPVLNRPEEGGFLDLTEKQIKISPQIPKGASYFGKKPKLTDDILGFLGNHPEFWESMMLDPDEIERAKKLAADYKSKLDKYKSKSKLSPQIPRELKGLWNAQYAPREKYLLSMVTPEAVRKWNGKSLTQKITIIDNLQARGIFDDIGKSERFFNWAQRPDDRKEPEDYVQTDGRGKMKAHRLGMKEDKEEVEKGRGPDLQERKRKRQSLVNQLISYQKPSAGLKLSERKKVIVKSEAEFGRKGTETTERNFGDWKRKEIRKKDFESPVASGSENPSGQM